MTTAPQRPLPPRLILVNGPPGVGKSTLAARYAADRPFTLLLDIDRVRGLLGGWRTDPTAAGVTARALALAMARTHLAAGHDVVVPQFLGVATFIERLEQVAADAGARFREIILLDGRDSVLRRFAERSRTSSDPVHGDADFLVRMSGGEPALAQAYDRLTALIPSRPGAIVVHIRAGDVEATYRDLLGAL